jgi:hypothetical protein
MSFVRLANPLERFSSRPPKQKAIHASHPQFSTCWQWVGMYRDGCPLQPGDRLAFVCSVVEIVSLDTKKKEKTCTFTPVETASKRFTWSLDSFVGYTVWRLASKLTPEERVTVEDGSFLW